MYFSKKMVPTQSKYYYHESIFYFSGQELSADAEDFGCENIQFYLLLKTLFCRLQQILLKNICGRVYSFFVFTQYFSLWLTCLICRSDMVLDFRRKLDESLKKQQRGSETVKMVEVAQLKTQLVQLSLNDRLLSDLKEIFEKLILLKSSIVLIVLVFQSQN